MARLRGHEQLNTEQHYSKEEYIMKNSVTNVTNYSVFKLKIVFIDNTVKYIIMTN